MIGKLAGHTAVYGISSIGARLLNYLLTPYLTRIMTTEVYGSITDIYALIPFLLVLLTMGLETGYFRFASNAPTPEGKRDVFQTTWGAITLVSILFFAVVLLFEKPIAEVMLYSDTPSFIWLLGGIVALDAVTAIPFARLRMENRRMRFVTIRLLSVIINILFCVFFYSVAPRIGALAPLFPSEYGAGYYLISNLIASFAVLLMLYPAYRGMRPRIDKKVFKTIFLYSLPLLISGIPGTANEYIDRQFIKYLSPQELSAGLLGIYGAVVKIGVVLVLFVQMYRLAAEPFFLSDVGKDDFKRVNAEAMKYFVIVSLFIFLVIALFPDLFALIIGRDFREGMYILPVVLVANIFSGIVVNLSFWYKTSGMTRFAIIITGTGLAVTVALNLLLVPKYNILGAAWARLGCEAVMVVVSYLLSVKYCRIPYDLRRIFLYFAVGMLIFIAATATNRLPSFAAIALNMAMITAFAVMAIRLEHISPQRLLNAIKRR